MCFECSLPGKTHSNVSTPVIMIQVNYVGLAGPKYRNWLREPWCRSHGLHCANLCPSRGRSVKSLLRTEGARPAPVADESPAQTHSLMQSEPRRSYKHLLGYLVASWLVVLWY